MEAHPPLLTRRRPALGRIRNSIQGPRDKYTYALLEGRITEDREGVGVDVCRSV